MKRILLSLVAVAAIAISGGASAQADYPNRPVKIIVPFTPGSSSDVAIRVMAKQMTGSLGQAIIIENRPGAGGAVGMQAAARSAPDGYTLIAVSSSVTVIAPALTKQLSYDPIKDFAPVSLMNKAPVLMVVAKDSPSSTVAELVADIKKRTGSYGNGAPVFELSMELFKKRAGIDLTNVQYKGVSEAAVDLLAGRLDVLPDTLASAAGMLKAGRTRPLAMMSSQRTPLLPNVPTMIELGYQDFEFDGWNGVLAPAGTPDAIVERIAAEMAKAAASPEVRQAMATTMIEPWVSSPREFREFIARETAKYAKLVAEAGIEKK